MNRKTLSFIALAISILYGVGFAAFETPDGYAVIGGAVVALAWISVGVFGKDEEPPAQPTGGGAAPTSGPEDAPPYGTPPQDR